MTLAFDQQQIDTLVTQISTDLKQNLTDSSNAVFVCVLNGGFMFFSDLVKRLPNDITCEFVKTSSYGLGQTQAKTVLVNLVPRNLEGKDVYIVDEIYDSGNTMKRLVQLFNEQNPKSITVVSLFKRAMSPDAPQGCGQFYGTMLSDEWLVGYGMNDGTGRYRNSNVVYKVG